MLEGWEFKRCGDTYDLGDLFRNVFCFFERKHESPSRSPWDPWGWYILPTFET